MTHLTYTVAHIIVGAEKPYVEALGRVAINLEDIEVKYLRTFNGFTRERKKILKQNLSHPLSELAKKLGAIVYGGFEDGKDFHLLLPTIEGLKVGDIIGEFILSFGNFEFLDDMGVIQEITGFYNRGSGEIKYNTYEQTFPFAQSQSNISEIENNIFQEYARTGIIENDLYKQFFK